MKTIKNAQNRAALIARIETLTNAHTPKWGKMDTFQMVKHGIISEEMYLGKKTYKRLFIGKIFGKMSLKSILKNEDPMKQNQPTHPDFKITGTGDLDQAKKQWISLLQEYETSNNTTFVHPFFGKMTPDQIGKYVYKHADHHLRQFNV